MRTVSDPIPFAPVRLVIRDNPPAVLLGPAGSEVDVRAAVEFLQVDLRPDGCSVLLGLRTELDFGFKVDRVAVAGGDPLAGLTAEELSSVVAGAPYSEPVGAAILRHLRSRLG